MVVEEHRQTGGLLTSISHYIASHGLHKKLVHASLPNTFLISGSYEDLTSFYGLDVKGISDQLTKLVSLL